MPSFNCITDSQHFAATFNLGACKVVFSIDTEKWIGRKCPLLYAFMVTPCSTKIRNKSACVSRLKAKITPTEKLQKSQSVGQPLIVSSTKMSILSHYTTNTLKNIVTIDENKKSSPDPIYFAFSEA